MPKTAKQISKVTERNTKNEILDAYQQLLDQLHKDTASDETAKQEQALLDSAAKETVDKVTKDLSQLKIVVNQTISNLTEQLTNEAERFATLQRAIAIAQKELEEKQQIKARAGMLYRLIETYTKEETQLEQEITSKRQTWLSEQQAYEERIKRERSREEDEYEYIKKLQRQRDLEAWEEEKRKREQRLAAEQEKQAQKDKELEELRKEVAQFPAQLDKAVKEAVAKTVMEERKEAQVRANFAKQDADTNAQIASLKISSLEKTVKEQREEIAELKRQLEKATQQVKDIAVTVIEGPRKETTDIQTKPVS